MTKTYSELRAEAYWRCAASLFDIARMTAEDVRDQELPPSQATCTWLAGVFETTMRQGEYQESLGCEQSIQPTRTRRRLYEKRAIARWAFTAATARLQEPVRA